MARSKTNQQQTPENPAPEDNTPEENGTPPSEPNPPTPPQEGEPEGQAAPEESPEEVGTPDAPQEENAGAGDGVSHDDAPYGLKADGTPAKKRGRPAKDAAAADEKDKQRARLRSVGPGKKVPQKLQAITPEPLAVVNYQAMGDLCANLFFNVGSMVLGEDWAPEDQGEALAVSAGFRDYCKAQQVKDIPPGFALTLILVGYTAKRVAKPTVKTRLQLFGAWVKDKVKGFRK